MRLLLTTLLSLLLSMPLLMSQKLDYRLGYMIVQLEKDVNPNAFTSSYSTHLRSDLSINRALSAPLGIYLVKFDYAVIHQGKLLDAFRSDRRVAIAQYDHFTHLRSVPNDPDFLSQWQWLNTGQTGGFDNSDIDADRAWDISTGGLTALGDTIVVAVIDGGLRYNHEDIVANAWINHHEIDGNNIDDDGNGYVDDVHGWDAYDNDPDILGESDDHGLQVCGLVGATGNNGIGVTGINWNVKIMMIRGGDPESSAIAAYSYALAQRELYESSNGALGAFVVATNSSWGIDAGKPSDAPLWCAFYDTMGDHGILSAAATANNDVNIDLVGDLPTACPSEYLLSVTALNDKDQRTFSGYGITNIDFGAPGENIFTTKSNNQYGHNSGTSFASPIAAGVIGLLYSTPCLNFAKLAHNDPSAAAVFVRDAIFMGIKSVPGLASETRFGGNLNIGNSMELMVSLCAACPIPFDVTTENVTDVNATITWSLLDTVDAINARYKLVNASEWDTLENVVSPLQLTGLSGCNEYEIEFESICSDTSAGYQPAIHFETDGCCELPAEINISASGTNINLNWTSVLAAAYYVIGFRPQGTTEWIEEATALNTYTIQDLQPCTFYEVRLQTSCDTTETGFSEIQTIRTKGCGNCIDLEYCANGSDDASGEFIDSLIIGPLVNHSGNNGGYAFFDSFDPLYITGNSYQVLLRPGFTSEPFNEQFRVWLDMNQDGIFDDAELLLDSILDENDASIVSSIVIDETALAGNTRMRVSMAYANPFFPANQPPCGQIEFGEIEDYCVNIIKHQVECPAVDTVYFDGVTFTAAFMYWSAIDEAIAYTYRYREVGTLDWKEIATIDTTANLSDLNKCLVYEVQVRTVCLFDTAGYDHNYLVETDCDVAVQDPADLLSSFLVFPNPTSDLAYVRMVPVESGPHSISIYNLQGQRLEYESVDGNANQTSTITLPSVSQFPAGLYFVTIERNGKLATQKLIRL